jgi:hypothetical protein
VTGFAKVDAVKAMLSPKGVNDTLPVFSTCSCSLKNKIVTGNVHNNLLLDLSIMNTGAPGAVFYLGTQTQRIFKLV